MIRTVRTKYGILEGVESNAGFGLFRGVPYAAPPVGELRWRAPQPPIPWEGVRKCDTFGSVCPQRDRWSNQPEHDDYGHPYIHIPNYPYPPVMDEDCLYMNIYTPAKTPEDKLPVMLYLHGGGVQEWYGSDYEYCGDGFCRHGCILVTINYRLNVFGYYVHPELAAESGHNASGNYGMMDQIQALKWLYENIAGFGGDPDNITVFGQSGGGRSTQGICCSPLAKGLVKHASIQSAGGVNPAFGGVTREEMESRGIKFMKDLGCSSIAEMRALPWKVIRDANMNMLKEGGFRMTFNIYGDGYVLPVNIDEAVVKGLNHDIDYIIGCTVDEGASEKPSRMGNMCASLRAFCKMQLKNGKKPAYMYVFDRPQPGDDVGTPHSCDNRYLFGTLDGTWRPYEECDWQLSETMLSYWSNFARTGNPNGEGLAEWKPFLEDKLGMRLAVDGCSMRDYSLGGKNDEEEDRILAKFL